MRHACRTLALAAAAALAGLGVAAGSVAAQTSPPPPPSPLPLPSPLPPELPSPLPGAQPLPVLAALEAAGLPGEGWLLGASLAQRIYATRWDLGDAGPNHRRDLVQYEAAAFVERPLLFRLGRGVGSGRVEVHGGVGRVWTPVPLGDVVVSDRASSLGVTAAARAVFGQPSSGQILLGAGLDLTRVSATGAPSPRYTTTDWFDAPWSERVLSMPLELGAWVPLGRWLGVGPVAAILETVMGPAWAWTDWTAAGLRPGGRLGVVRWAVVGLAVGL